MAEGISTSPQTYPPPSEDFHELPAPEGLPPPFVSHLHVNDLGLTPSPGSQQQQQQPQQKLSATHVLSRDEHGLSDEGAAIANKPATKDTKKQEEGLSIDTGDEFFDPLFDTDLALQDLESDFLSHKRTHDEAFFEDFSSGEPPEKRQVQDESNSAITDRKSVV